MAPSIQDDYIIAVDAAQVELSKLYGKIVIAWHKDKGLIVSRLQRFDGTELLMPDSREHEPVSLSGSQLADFGQGFVVDRFGGLRMAELFKIDHFCTGF